MAALPWCDPTCAGAGCDPVVCRGTSLTNASLFERATTGFGRHVHAVRAGQWHDPTPCAEWDVRQLVNHTIGAVFFMGMAAAGQPAPQGESPDFTAGPSAVTFRQAADAALEAWPAAMDKNVNLGDAEMPGRVAIGVNLLDTLTHGWDIAIATGEIPEGAGFKDLDLLLGVRQLRLTELE